MPEIYNGLVIMASAAPEQQLAKIRIFKHHPSDFEPIIERLVDGEWRAVKAIVAVD